MIIKFKSSDTYKFVWSRSFSQNYIKNMEKEST